MFETYPKGSKNPSSSIGEQESREGWDRNTCKTRYPGGGASTTTYSGDRSHTKLCKGGQGSKNGSDYPGTKYESFGTERMDKR